jgi:UDP-GlcNAc:undecaprenyl-phosphate GlcNAc-1-phosphate transferase
MQAEARESGAQAGRHGSAAADPGQPDAGDEDAQNPVTVGVAGANGATAIGGRGSSKVRI